MAPDCYGLHFLWGFEEDNTRVEFGHDKPRKWPQPCPGRLCILGYSKSKCPLLHGGETFKAFKVSFSLDTLELKFQGFRDSIQFHIAVDIRTELDTSGDS